MSDQLFWSGDDKRRFRAKKIWKDFAKNLIEERGCRCELCGSEKKSSSGLDVHHLDPEHYDILQRHKFKILDTKCHDLVEWMAIRLAAGGESVPNREAILAWLGPFLPKIVRHYGAEVKPKKILQKGS